MQASYEEIFFFLDLTKHILKKKDIIKAIKNFIQEKNKININGHYGILMFTEDGNPIFIKDKKDAEILTKSIDENWERRTKELSFFENGLFYIFSYIAETIRKRAKSNRIIIITDTPSDLAEEYQKALFDLASKIKVFPTFIDIIRVADSEKRFFKDDVKLNILASDTKGGMFYTKNKKEFQEVLKKLVKNKQVISTFIGDKPDQFKIAKEDHTFYDNLALDLKPPDSWQDLKCYFCQDIICPICKDTYDVPYLCEKCGSAFHKCCIINYVIEGGSIGIPHIFRCPNCDILLKIEENEIVEESPEMPINGSKSVPMENFEKSKIDTHPKIIEITNIEKSKEDINKSSKIENLYEGETKKIRVGGFFGKYYTLKKVGDKLVYQKTTKRSVSQINKTQQNHSNQEPWKPSNSEINNKQKIKICPLCGYQLDKDAMKCLKCGYKF
jgi:hypothetical protein